MKLYQQGDCLLKSTKTIPVDAHKLNHTILAHGEATGHRHMAVAEDAELYERNGVLYLSIPSGSRVQHEEHHAIDVPPGVYQVDLVREYDHFAEDARSVVD